MNKEYLCINDKIIYETKGSTPKYVDKSTKIVLNQKCIRNGMIDYSFAQYISDQQNISDEKYVKIGDVLLNSTGQGTAGRCAFVDHLPENYKVTVDSHMLILRFKNIELARFFAYSLYNQENYILELLTGSSGQGELDREIVYNISFPYSNLNLAIFNQILVSINKKIELNNKIKTKLEKMAKDLYNYWFIQFDFPDENGQPYKTSDGEMFYNEILKREIPKGWEVKELQNIVSISNEQITPKENTIYKHYSIPAFDEKGTYTLDLGINIRSNKSIVKPCDILISKLNPRFSRVICATNEENMISSTELIVFRCNNHEDQALIYCIAKSDNFYSYCIKNATGSSGSHNRINSEIMGAFKIPYNDSIYKAFKSHIDCVIQKRNLIINENQKLKNLRDFLLPILMNGRVTVADSQEDNLSEEKIIKKSLEFWQSHEKMDIDQFARENGILVYKDNEQKKGAVSYNAEKDLYEIAIKDPRDNFTIAHEIGHILKHKKELKTGTLGRKSEESGTKIMEHEADSLAAEILMPEKYVLQYMQDKNKTEKDYLDEKFIKECAKYFNVNPPTINIRLKNLGYKVPYIR